MLEGIRFHKIRMIGSKAKTADESYCGTCVSKFVSTPSTIGKSVISSIVAALTLVTALRYNEWISHIIDNSSLKNHGDLLSAVILTIVTVVVANLGGLLEEGATKLPSLLTQSEVRRLQEQDNSDKNTIGI